MRGDKDVLGVLGKTAGKAAPRDDPQACDVARCHGGAPLAAAWVGERVAAARGKAVQVELIRLTLG